MAYKVEEQDLNKFIMIGDRVLLKPKENQNKTKSGLYLPPNVQEKETVHSGYVVKVGPGYPIPAVTDADEPWKEQPEEVKYVPLQPQEGDLAVYLQNNAWEVDFNGQKYVVLPQSAILFLIRDESLFT